MVGDALSITARMTIALEQVLIARADGDPDREWGWSSMLDRLLDVHLKLLQDNGCFKTLKVLDPELDARLTVTPSYRLIGMGGGTNSSSR